MATIEVEKRIQELEPQFLQALSDYLDYLFFLQKNQEGKDGKHPKRAAKLKKEIEAPSPLADAETDDRLKVLRQFKGIAPKPTTGVETGAVNAATEDIPERLRIARQFKGDAPKPHFPVTKYDVYEQ